MATNAYFKIKSVVKMNFLIKILDNASVTLILLELIMFAISFVALMAISSMEIVSVEIILSGKIINALDLFVLLIPILILKAYVYVILALLLTTISAIEHALSIKGLIQLQMYVFNAMVRDIIFKISFANALILIS